MKYGKGVFAGAVTAILGTTAVAAQDESADIASAGNGGVATAGANGGAASAGDINSGGNACNAIGVGDTFGFEDPAVYGGDCLNTTGLAIAVDGGTAIADATGGNNNLAFVS